jgi:pimeloyl-ACP methyl ester carboxylesterase
VTIPGLAGDLAHAEVFRGRFGCVLLYLHGFASGPASRKACHVAEVLGARGVAVAVPDLTPGPDGFERSTPLTMLLEARRALGDGPGPHAIVGSSLGGYLAALLASQDPRIARLVLLAPAFRLFERWSGRLSPAQLDQWRSQGLPTRHHVTQTMRCIGWPFFEAARTLPALPEVAVPALVIAGARDETVPLADVQAWVDRTPTARLITVDDGHDLLASLDRIGRETWDFLRPVAGG